MEGSEYPAPSGTAAQTYRLSWLAYVKTVLKFVVMAAIAAGVAFWTWNAARTDVSLQAGISASMGLLLIALAMFIYRIFYLRSVRLYTDEVGVWIYRGILPWSRGTNGVKWRDLEDAVYYTGFFSWLFRSYTVRIGHRFTKTSEIVVADLARGHKAVEHINQVHRDALRTEQAADA